MGPSLGEASSTRFGWRGVSSEGGRDAEAWGERGDAGENDPILQLILMTKARGMEDVQVVLSDLNSGDCLPAVACFVSSRPLSRSMRVRNIQ